MRRIYLSVALFAVMPMALVAAEPTSYPRQYPKIPSSRSTRSAMARSSYFSRAQPTTSPSDEDFVPVLPGEGGEVNAGVDEAPSAAPVNVTDYGTGATSPSTSCASCGCGGGEVGCCDTCQACGGSCGSNCCGACGSSRCDACGSCGGCGCGCSCGCQAGTAEPHRLFGNCGVLTCNNISIYGWIDQSYTFNADDPTSRFNGPLTFNDRDEWLGNQAYVVMERPIDTSCGWDVGGRVDVLYGSDFRFTQARGLETRRDLGAKWNSEMYYGLALPQAYAEVGAGNLSVKLGHFYRIVGYEVVPAVGNFFLSHAYTMQYGEPFTHTGMLATYKLNDHWSTNGGFHRGWDNWEGDDLDRLSFLGGLTWTGYDDSSLAFAITHGDQDATPVGDNLEIVSTVTMYSVVYKRTLWNGFEYILQHDYGWSDIDDDIEFSDTDWYGVNQYWLKEINDCWSLGFRFEWFRDDDGSRVAAAGNNNAARYGARNPASSGGFLGNFYEFTAGLNYTPCPNLLVRHAIRWDWFDGDNEFVPLPFDDGNSDDQLTLSVDAILHF